MDSNSKSDDEKPGTSSNDDNDKDSSSPAWARHSMELFEAYLEYQLQHGNAEMSPTDHKAHVKNLHQYRQSFPKPMMSYYPYIFAAAPHIPMPRLSPTLSETERASPFGSRLVFRIEEIIGSDSASSAGSDTSSENGSPTENGDGDVENNDKPDEQPKPDDPPQEQDTSQPQAGATAATGAPGLPDTLHGFANFIAEYSAKHGITTDEAMAQMMYATELFQIEQDLLREVTEQIAAVNVNNDEVNQELKSPETELETESESIQLTSASATEGLETNEVENGAPAADIAQIPLEEEDKSAAPNELNEPNMDKEPNAANLLESATATETAAPVSLLELEPPAPAAPKPEAPNSSEVIEEVYTQHATRTFSAPTSTTAYTFRAPASLGQGYRTGTFYRTPDQRTYASMRMTHPHNLNQPTMYWSPQCPQPYVDHYGYYAPPAALRFGPPPPASNTLTTYQPPVPTSIQEIALGGSYPPPMQLPPPFMASGPFTETNKKGICPFCRRNGEDESVYRSHNLYQPGTRKVICPVLRRFKCELCGASGDFAHTRGYCKFNDPNYVPSPPPPPPPPPAAFQ